MTTTLEARVIHSYDTELHRVRCGVVEQSNSTKHAHDVTCVTCRRLLEGARPETPVAALSAPEP